MNKNDYRFLKRDWMIIAGFFAIIFFALCIGLAIYSNMLKERFANDLNNEFKISVMEISHEIDKITSSDMSTLSNIAEVVNGYTTDTPISTIKDSLVRIANHEGYKQVGLASNSGIALTSDSAEINIAGTDFFIEAWNGNTYTTGVYKSPLDGEKVITTAVPITTNNKTSGVFFTTRSMDKYEAAIKRESEYGNGIIVSKQGDIIMNTDPTNTFVNSSYNNVYSFLTDEGNNRLINDLKNNILDLQSGHIPVTINGNKYQAYYMPLNTHDWYIMYVVDNDKINSSINPILHLTTVLMCIIFFAFFIFFAGFIFQQKRSTRILESLAFTDDVTGISNKNKFRMTSEKILLSDNASQFAFVHFDIDKFKVINENFGFYAGNTILKNIAKIMENFNDTFVDFARVNNDNFVALAKYKTRAQLSTKINEFFSAVEKNSLTGTVDNCEIVLTMGLYEVIDKSKDINTMMDRANMARESIKGFHKSNFTFYNNKMREGILREKQMEDEMYSALENNEFLVYYQPKHSIKDGALMGSEALVRWQHPIEGIISPANFIPLFEKNGFIIKLDEFVFERVCYDIRKWLDNGFEVMPVSVNFSKSHLYDVDFVDKYKAILDKYNLSADYLELEITENFMIENLNALLKTMLKLSDIGFKISMDDFGSGYSSLNMLKDVPVNCIKLDRVFLIDTMDNTKGKQIVEAVVNLAKKMDITVVAEGVETEEQLSFLKAIECEIAQGYYFDRPLSKDSFENKMKKVI